MEILDGASTLNLAQQIVKLVYSDEYKCQYDPNAKSFTNPRGLENWIKSDELKRLLGINHPLVTAYMRQIDTLQYGSCEDYNGSMQFRFHVPNNFGSEDIQEYTLAWLLDFYGDLRGAILELYKIATNLWEPNGGEWDGIPDWERSRWVPSDKLAATLDKDHVALMDFMILNMLDRHYDTEHWEGWFFFKYEGEVYIGMADHYFQGLISLEEFLTSPMDHQVIGSPTGKWSQTTQAITLQGVINAAKLIDWRTQ